MRGRYVVRPRADADIDEIADYLADKASLEMGLRFLAELYETFGMLGAQPDMGWSPKVGRAELAGMRAFRASARFEKYLVFYRPLEDRIEVVRVLHGSQDLALLSQDAWE